MLQLPLWKRWMSEKVLGFDELGGKGLYLRFKRAVYDFTQ